MDAMPRFLSMNFYTRHSQTQYYSRDKSTENPKCSAKMFRGKTLRQYNLGSCFKKLSDNLKGHVRVNEVGCFPHISSDSCRKLSCHCPADIN